MINRRRPIQSVVEGRKLFANGGMATQQPMGGPPPPPMNQPMGGPLQMGGPPMGPPPMGGPPMGGPPMGPQPMGGPPMGGPMGAPPMGILNSSPELSQAASFTKSPPLLDSLVDEMASGYAQGLADKTSMNNAPVPMAQGGMASEDMMESYRHGGFHYNRQGMNSLLRDQQRQSVPDDGLGAAWASGEGRGVVRPVAQNARVLPVLGPAIQAEEPAASAMIQQSNKFLNQVGPSTGDYTSLDNMQFLSPYKLDPSLDFNVQTFSSTGDINPMNLNTLIEESSKDKGDRWFDVPLLNEPGRQQKEAPAAALVRQAAGAVSATTKILARSLSSLWNAQFDGETADRYNAEGWGGKAFMVASMIESQPGFKEEIEALTTELITKNPKIGPTELKNAVAYALSNKYEIGPQAGAINKAGIKAEREGVIADLTSGESLTAEEYEKMKAAEAAEAAEAAALTEGEDFSNLFYGPGGEGLAIDEEDRVRAEADEAIDFLKRGVTDETGMPRDPTAAEAGELARIAAANEARFREVGLADETGMPRDPTDAEATELAEGDIAALTEGEEFATLTDQLKAAENLALSRFGSKTNMKPAEGKRILEDYMKEFKKVAPEYEGMSDSEKWIAVAEAGFRIMAGQSSNAITNIAKGLKGLGSELAKDAKEKRAYDRQIGLSAAKYSLTSMAKDREQEIALAAEGRKRPFQLVAQKDFVMDGVTIKKGTAVPLTNNQINDGYLTKFPITYRETFLSNAEALVDLQKAVTKGLIDPQKFSDSRKTYLKNTRSLRNGVRMKSLLMEAAKIAIPEGAQDNDVLGAVPLFKSWVDKGLNAAGYQMKTEAGRSKLNALRSTKPAEYRTLVKTIGTTMVTEILNESNKTISDGDRKRVEELVAAYSAFDGTFASYKELVIKLKNLEQTINIGIEEAGRSMASIETQWGNAQFKGGSSAQKVFSTAKNFGRGFSYNVGQQRAAPIPYKDIINMKTRKFTPKYQQIFGKG